MSAVAVVGRRVRYTGRSLPMVTGKTGEVIGLDERGAVLVQFDCGAGRCSPLHLEAA